MWISAWQYIGDTPQTGDPVLEPSQPGPSYTYTESAILEIISLHINVKGWTWRVDLSDIQTFRLQLSRKTSKTLARLVLPVSVRLVSRWLHLTLHFTRLHLIARQKSTFKDMVLLTAFSIFPANNEALQKRWRVLVLLPGLLGRANLIKSHAGWIHLQCSAATRAGGDGETSGWEGKILRDHYFCV